MKAHRYVREECYDGTFRGQETLVQKWRCEDCNDEKVLPESWDAPENSGQCFPKERTQVGTRNTCSMPKLPSSMQGNPNTSGTSGSARFPGKGLKRR